MNAEQRERSTPMLNTGSCLVLAVSRTGVSVPLAIIRTELGETFAVFDHDVMTTLESAQRSQRRCDITIRRTPKGRYIASVRLYPPPDEALWRCVRCDAPVERSDDGVFRCAHCHFVMEAR